MSRELDAEVAEKVMGEQKPDYPDPHNMWSSSIGRSKGGAWYHPRNGDGWVPMYFSRDISAAMEVVEKMRGLGWFFEASNASHGWNVNFFWQSDDWNEHPLDAPTLPEAICRAALAAVTPSS